MIQRIDLDDGFGSLTTVLRLSDTAVELLTRGRPLIFYIIGIAIDENQSQIRIMQNDLFTHLARKVLATTKTISLLSLI